MSIQALTFTGVSSFSDDFQAIVSRSVAIASLPIRALQSDQQELIGQRVALSGLQETASGLRDALNGLTSMASGNSMTVSSSASSLVRASVDGTPTRGTYNITEITKLASLAIATSSGSYPTTDGDPVAGVTRELELVVDGQDYLITLGESENNLEGVKEAINRLGAGVTASIIQAGEGNYHLVVSALKTGQQDIELRYTPGSSASNLLSMTSPGSDASFKINGQLVTRPSNTITNVVPGVSLELSGTTSGAEKIQITVSGTRYGLQSALQAMADAYNDVVSYVGQHRGEGAGVLQGHYLLREVDEIARSVGAWQGSGTSQSLYEMGIQFDQNGRMSLDVSQIDLLSDGQYEELLGELSNPASGFARAAKQLTGLADPVTGSVRMEQDGLTETDKALSRQVAAIEARILDMQSTLMTRLQAADVLLAHLESQQGLLDASLASLNMVLYGRKDG